MREREREDLHGQRERVEEARKGGVPPSADLPSSSLSFLPFATLGELTPASHSLERQI